MAVEARVTVVPAITELKAVPLTVTASASKVPSISTSPDISSSVATILSLKVAAPAALPSSVKNVVSEPPSVPLKIMSESFACASIVILPDVVAIVTAASPVEISSAAELLAVASVNSSIESSDFLIYNFPATAPIASSPTAISLVPGAFVLVVLRFSFIT